MPSLNILEKHKELAQIADRGGLSQPTELCFGIYGIFNYSCSYGIYFSGMRKGDASKVFSQFESS